MVESRHTTLGLINPLYKSLELSGLICKFPPTTLSPGSKICTNWYYSSNCAHQTMPGASQDWPLWDADTNEAGSWAPSRWGKQRRWKGPSQKATIMPEAPTSENNSHQINQVSENSLSCRNHSSRSQPNLRTWSFYKESSHPNQFS